MQSIEEQVLAIVEREFGIPPGRITADSRLHDHGDSLDWFSLLSELEEAFGIEISDDQSRQLVTVEDLLGLIRSHATV
jgi:acyl carrier protein